MRRFPLALVVAFAVGAPAFALAQPAADKPAAEQPITATPGGEGNPAADTKTGEEDPSRDFNWVKHMPFGYRKLDVKGGPLGDGKLGDEPLKPGEHEENMSPPFVLMALNFLLLVLILTRYGSPFARKIAETRSDQIKTALDEAAVLRDQAKAKLDEYSAKLATADAEITKMIDGMRTDAEEDRKRVMAAAEVAAAALKKDAEERIAAEIDLARHALAREVAIASAAVAEKLIRDKATAGDQTRLVDGFITELGARPATQKEPS